MSAGDITRRAALVSGALLPLAGCEREVARAVSLVTGIAPGDAAAAHCPQPEGLPAFRPSTPAGLPIPTVPGGLAPARYRSQHHFLFQGSGWAVDPARIAGLADRPGHAGPNEAYVDLYTGWRWDRVGGDWIDRQSVRHGSAAWSTVTTQRGPQPQPVTYAMDVTEVVRRVQSEGRWCAFKLVSQPGHRKLGGRWGDPAQAPRLDVRHEDGTRAVLALVTTAACVASAPRSADREVQLPAFVEFERPTKSVQSAVLQITCTHHGSGAAEIALFLIDPPLNQSAVRQGVAALARPLDDGIDSAPGVIGAQRHVDGSTIDDFVLPGTVNTWASREFDPALWGAPPDTTKLPHRGLGKFITASGPRWGEFVDSSFRGDGFQPLASGLGAIRMVMKLAPGARCDGQVVGYSGSLGANASIFMAEPLFGRVDRIFVRHYVRLGLPGGKPYLRTPSQRYHVYNDPGNGNPKRVDWAGKWGITPNHTTTYGGGSGSSGGGNGWQLRLAWSDSDLMANGPNEGGIRPGFHLYDFGPVQPRGHDYSGDTAAKAMFGQLGGLGGILYAGQWYCIETELKLNTVMDAAPGYLPDGELRAWVDGRLVFERVGMVFRSKPLKGDLPPKPSEMPPLRELGVRGLWLNWFHGGVTQDSVERVMFFTGLAYGTQYIGPMRLSA